MSRLFTVPLRPAGGTRIRCDGIIARPNARRAERPVPIIASRPAGSRPAPCRNRFRKSEVAATIAAPPARPPPTWSASPGIAAEADGTSRVRALTSWQIHHDIVYSLTTL